MKYLLITLGFISLTLGIIGMFLPILPTTPFLLLTAALWIRSSKDLYDKLMAHPKLGPYIRDFQENKSLTLKTKVYILTLMWVSMICSAWFATDKLWLRLVLMGIAVGITIHILRFKTRKS